MPRSRTTLQRRPGPWPLFVAAGLILGFALLCDWPAYQDYAWLDVGPFWRYLLGFAAGLLVAYLARGYRDYATGTVVVVTVALAVPIAATVATAQLLDTTELLDIMFFSALRTALAFSIPLVLVMVLGIALGVVALAGRR